SSVASPSRSTPASPLPATTTDQQVAPFPGSQVTPMSNTIPATVPSGLLSGDAPAVVDPAPSPDTPVTGRPAVNVVEPVPGATPRVVAVPRDNVPTRPTPAAASTVGRDVVNSVGREPEPLPTGARAARHDEDDTEHRVPDYLKEPDPEGVFGIRAQVAPPVIGA
ncbi:MAG TPA: hypothetical protein VGD84_21415, partial [Pseudonocardiaceae bacterium]